MNKYKGLKIATISGKGADGCGVQRTSAELVIWANKVGASVDYYAYEKKFGRANGHGMTILPFNLKNIKETDKKINGILSFDENYEIKFVEKRVEVEYKKFVGNICPKCQKGKVIKGKSAFGCSEWKNGCSFRTAFDSPLGLKLKEEY